MFTGIINHCGKVEKAIHQATHSAITITHHFANVKLGESIAVNGVCLTVTDMKNQTFNFDVSIETKMLTTLGTLKPGDIVNLERSLAVGDLLGGHFVSGHIDQMVSLTAIKHFPPYQELVFSGIKQEALKFLVKKGSIAVNGVSLTINELTEDGFKVMLIPHTLEITQLGVLKIGDLANVEYDMLAKFVDRRFTPFIEAIC